MGNIDKAVPFFGDGFNSIYPLIMVIYTILVASNFFDKVIDRVVSFFGNWKIFRLQTETDDVDGFDPSGLLILQRGKCLKHFLHVILFPFDVGKSSSIVFFQTSTERTWLEQGRKVGEHVIPLARIFNGASLDLESGSNNIVC